MALITRVARLFTADLHAVLDRLEEPEALLRQAIREMDDEIAQQELRANGLRREQADLGRQIAAADKTLAALDERLDLCFAAGNEALARQITRRKLETERFAERLTSRREALARALDELETSLAGHRDRLEGMRQKAELFGAGEAAADRDAHADSERLGVDEAEVELALIREKQARENRAPRAGSERGARTPS
jgi:phage shock protein A